MIDMKIVLLLTLALSVAACSPQVLIDKNNNYHGKTITENSVVATIEPYVSIDYDSEPSISMRIKHREACSAVAVTDQATTFLVAAAHCLIKPAQGKQFRYEYLNGVGTELATIEAISNDVVYASTEDSRLDPIQIDRSYVPSTNDQAFVVSSTFESVNSGHVIGKLSSVSYDTDNTIVRGWSGSPVLNKNGYVWGIVYGCLVENGETECEPNYTVVSKIY